MGSSLRCGRRAEGATDAGGLQLEDSHMTRHPASSRSRLLLTAALLTGALASPADARGQQRQQRRLDPVRVAAEASDAASRADALDARATEYEQSYRHPRDLRVSAELHERAAGLRSPTDPRGSASLQRAALERYYVGDLAAAGDLMEAAAARAAAMGDVVCAVDAYVDAAFVRVELGQSRRAVALVDHATILASSPLLSVAQRRALRARIAPARPASALVTAVVRR